MAERVKKYKQLATLPNELLKDLIVDAEEFNTYVSNWYTKTTSGGEGILWQVNDRQKGLHWTVSTGAVSSYRVNRTVSVNVYRHYVLTEAGIQFVKEQMMELKCSGIE